MIESPDDKKTDEPADRNPAPKDELLHSILHPKCDLCGSMMVESHCKLICPMCGYQRDCSDP